VTPPDSGPTSTEEPTAAARPAPRPDPESTAGDRTESIESPTRRLSVAGRITAGFLAVLVLTAALAALATRLELSPWLVFLAILAVCLPLGAWVIGRLVRPIDRVIGGVADGIRSFRDRDFGVRLAYRRNDELGDLVRLYNRVGEILQDERRSLTQQELLLKTALDRSPAAIVLVNPIGRVIYSNREARTLFTGGRQLEGMSFREIRDGCPTEMREILASASDGLFTVVEDDQHETYHLSQRVFTINRRRHLLVLLRRMTGELGRQEAEVWKKVIRVISHELNNSIAPISSLVHSARLISEKPEHAARSAEVFSTLRERLDDLSGFIDGYAKFARLPRPQPQEVDWNEFLRGFAEYEEVVFPRELPTYAGWFDPAQLRQVLINLFKNAIEASPGEPDIELHIETTGDGETWIQVSDRGPGMDDETLRKALLPFYSTKKAGTGLGLPLCREVIEGHGGRLTLQNRGRGGTRVTCWLPGPRGDAGAAGRLGDPTDTCLRSGPDAG
jgi:nitrogen fixation/metabolism regulation signal transduction histidine kinase